MARARAAGHELGAVLRRILCISAHPDDNEFTIAGSVARWAREGRHVTFCLVTTGGAGVNEHTPSSEGLIPIRERETHAAARMLGVKDVILLGYADGTLEPTLTMRRDLTRVIRRVRPDIVVCSDPTVRFYGNEYMNHPDHRAVASAALDAIFRPPRRAPSSPSCSPRACRRTRSSRSSSRARSPPTCSWTSRPRWAPSAARSRRTARRWARANGSSSS